MSAKNCNIEGQQYRKNHVNDMVKRFFVTFIERIVIIIIIVIITIIIQYL